MANDVVPAGGSDGSLVVTVDSRQGIAGLRAIEVQFLNFGRTVDTQMAKMGSSFSKFTSFLKSAGAAIGSYFALKGVINMFEALIGRIIEVNRVYTGFIASMKVIKGSTQAASAEYGFLLAMSNKLGVSVETSINQYHRLAAALKNVDTTGELTRHIFSGLSQAAVVLHSKGRDVTLIFEAVQQMASKGKLSLEELQRQLGNTLPGAMGLAARAMMQSQSFVAAGVKTAAESERKLRDGISKGTINVYEFLARLSNQLKKEYGDGVKYATDQFTANFNRMKNSVFELYRVVGSSDAMKGLTSVVREITGLFNDSGAAGAAGIGKALGSMFEDLAKWIGNLSSADVQEFFAAVQMSLVSTSIVTASFLDVFKQIGSPEMETPLLDFVQFVAESMGGLVDLISAAVTGIQMLLNSLANAWIATKSMFLGGDIAGGIRDSIDRFGNRMGVTIPGAGVRQWHREAQANNNAADYQNEVDYLGLAGKGDAAFGQYGAQSTSQRINSQFEQMRKKLIANQAAGKKAGTTADLAAAYVNPLGDADLQKMLDEIKKNSNAPTSTEPKGKKGRSDPVQSNFLREQTRLLKGVATAENELQNVMANRNRSEGENVAQMRSLIATDDRYIKLSQEKKDKLMSWAAQLDAANLKVENAIKAQKAWNDSLQAGFTVQDKLAEIAATGYVSKYRAESSMSNSFKEGGDNEFMDELNRTKMLAAARKEDADQRNLDMAEYAASLRQSNEEMKFQASLLGLSTLEQQKLTEFRKIDLSVQQMMVGATLEQQQAYLRLGEILKVDVAESLDFVAAKQKDVMTGIMTELNRYMDEVSNRGAEWGNVTSNAISGMEDALVSFVETGKLSFKDLTQSIAKDLVKLIARYLIIMLLQRMTGLGASTGGGMDTSAFTGGMTGDYTGALQSVAGGGLPASAKGNVFTRMFRFAKGGDFTNTIVRSSTLFKYAKGTKMGEMGEKGPEAIMPLKRGSDGSLGVAVNGGTSGEATLNLTVEVYQGEGDGVKTEKSSDQNGDVLKIFIGEVAADVQRGGPVGKAITQVYGIKRSPKAYT